MGKRPQSVDPRILLLLIREAAAFISRWLPALEKHTRQSVMGVQNYRQSKKQAAALTPRKARLLWLLPLPLIPAIVIAMTGGQFSAFAANAGSYALFLLGARLTHLGFVQELKQQQQQFQTNRAWPFKTLGGLTVALATALTAWVGANHTIPIALAYGAGAFTAFILLYGLDPRQQSMIADRQNKNSQRVSKALQQAEQKILAIELASHQINQPELNQRLARINTIARNILEEIARNPKVLRRTRKFLNTYLSGTQRVVTGYVEAHTGGQPHPLENNFRRILITLEDVFRLQHQRLLENDLNDLDVQMEVLETQLRNEGIT